MAAVIFALFFAMNTRAANRWLIKRINNNEEVYSEKVPALALTAITLFSVGIVASVLSFFMEPWQEVFNAPSAELAAWVIASAIVGTALRFLIQTYAQSLSTHSHGVVILTAEPVFTAAIAAYWFAETMRPIQIAGCALILTALLVARWSAIRSLFMGSEKR
jgi:drug/metabolite transporter (DMT)-like permease